MSQASSGHGRITTDGLCWFSASGAPYPAPGPSKNDSGGRAGPGKRVETSGGRRREKIMTSWVWVGWPLMLNSAVPA
eukprot:7165516-Pyramimonas_sp.AAC.1